MMTNEQPNGATYHNLYIGGQWRAGHTEQYEPVYNPATSEILAYVVKADAEDTRDAIRVARLAFDEGPWPQMAPGERSRIMHKIVDALQEHEEELADLEMNNGGCTWRKAHLMDIPVGLLHFRHFAKLAGFEPLEPVPQITFPSLSYNFVHREPIGVCGQIIPWNFPFMMAVWKIAPALAAGNTIVLKPASLTPLERAAHVRDHFRDRSVATGRARTSSPGLARPSARSLAGARWSTRSPSPAAPRWGER